MKKDKRRRILFIAPVCPFGHHGGHATRTRQILKLLQEEHDVWFLYAPFRVGPANPLDREMLGDRLIEYPPSTIRLHKSLSRIKSWFGVYKSQPISETLLKSSDDISPPGLAKLCRKLVFENNFDTVLVGYVFLTKAFQYLPDSIHKIVDTHDEFSLRHKAMEKKGVMAWPWFKANISDENEAESLNRADVTIAIQHEEADKFRRKGVKCCEVIPFVPDYIYKSSQDTRKVPSEKNILYFGSAWMPNVHGLKWFLDEVWPKILEKESAAHLYVVGKVCDALNDPPLGVTQVGYVEDLQKFSEKTRVFICPVFHGTGFNVKLIDAMAWGMPFVGTSKSIRGLLIPETFSFYIQDTPLRFADDVIKLLRSDEECLQLTSQALSYVDILKMESRNSLKKALR